MCVAVIRLSVIEACTPGSPRFPISPAKTNCHCHRKQRERTRFRHKGDRPRVSNVELNGDWITVFIPLVRPDSLSLYVKSSSFTFNDLLILWVQCYCN